MGPRETPTAPPPPPQIFEDIDFILAMVLLFQWLPRLYFTLNVLELLKSLWAAFTVVSCFSVTLVYFSYAYFSGRWCRCVFVSISILAVIDNANIRLHESLSRCFKVGKHSFTKSPITQKAVLIGLTITSTLAIVAAWVHICLYKVQKYYDLSYGDIFYTIVVSSTSGLSTQIVPDNNLMMVVGAIYIPAQLSELLALMSNVSKYAIPYESIGRQQHALLIGNLEIVSLRGFLREFFSSDHGTLTLTTKIVILAPDEPSAELEALLHDPVYSQRVQYVKGSAISFKALKKVKAENAVAAFILSTDHILCIDEFKLGMAAQSCLAPGFSTLLYLLTNSISEKTGGDLQSYGDKEWIREYLNGAVMELYEIKLSETYQNIKFGDAAIAVFKHFGVILFALGLDTVETEDGTFGANQRIVFNPQDRVLRGGERAYVITDQSATARQVARFKFDDIHHDIHNLSFWNNEQINLHFAKAMKHFTSSEKKSLRSISRTDKSQFESLEQLPVVDSSNGKGKKPMQSDFTVIPARKNSQNVEAEAPSAAQICGTSSNGTSTSLGKDSDSKSSVKKSKGAFDSWIAPLMALDTTVLSPDSNEPSYKPGYTLPESVTKHVLYCGLAMSFPITLAYFIAPYRQKDPLTPIVVLCTSPPDPEDWALLEEYNYIYYIIGTPLLRRDLRKAKVSEASRTVVFADPYLENTSHRSVDSTALLSLLNIQALCSDDENFVIVEFIHNQNMKLIGNATFKQPTVNASNVTQMHLQNIIPAFCGGHVFSQSMFHSILCQAYYEHNLLAVLKLFLFNGTEGAQETPTSCTGQFYQVPLPVDDRFVGLPFGTLFSLLIQQYKCIPLGLYRQSLESEEKRFQYVILKPTPSLIIRTGDCVFLIGPRKPAWDVV
ncbi:calcium-activated BK potassium channel alpha subunit-domain-containing protein [Globomyces pollinis-pini]|nr:calcium-activated BK potassium channel alpha subunit-domain-containing protein [Globomyces pollinis-pini]